MVRRTSKRAGARWRLPITLGLSTNRPAQECHDPFDALRRIETGLAITVAMSRSVDDVEMDVEAEGLVRPLQLVSLIDRHLRILIAVQQKERRIGPIDVHHRACQL